MVLAMKTWSAANAVLAIFLIVSHLPAQAATRTCSALFEKQAAKPRFRRAGLQFINIDPFGTPRKVYVAMPREGGTVANMNTFYGKVEPLPEHFLVSEGTLASAFIDVNVKRGSRLRGIVHRMTLEVKRRIRAGGDPIEIMRTFIGEHLGLQPEEARPGLDPQVPIPTSPTEWEEVGKLSPGHQPLLTAIDHRVMNLEDFYDLGYGRCMPKVLFTSLILNRLGIPHRIVNGAYQAGGENQPITGHVWIELADGRILDPAWQVVGHPGKIGEDGAAPGWFRFSNSFLYRSINYMLTVEP